MLRKQRGSVSVFLLLIALLLALMAQLLLVWSRYEWQKAREHVLLRQLRTLNTSFFRRLREEELASGIWQVYEGTLLPGNESVQVAVTSSYSTDELLHYLEVKSTVANHDGAVQRLRRILLKTSEKQRSLGGRYALVSKKNSGFEDYLTQKELYIQASTSEEVKLPALSFLASKTTANSTAAEMVDEGLSRYFHYYTSKSGLTIPNGSTIYGSGVLCGRYGITIGNDCIFPERLALFTPNSNIVIGDNVRMNKALIHAYGSVQIGSGCRINGLIIANQIILKGKSVFSADADVVEPFASCAFMN